MPKKPESIAQTSKILRIFDPASCQWEKCTEGQGGRRGLITTRKKYCSNKCRKNQARFNYTQRKKREKANA
tara:strand:+ start:1904 stop:2116 length:213 start_codon:yes stop_codon:yes gene_type:complete